MHKIKEVIESRAATLSAGNITAMTAHYAPDESVPFAMDGSLRACVDLEP
ncbi:hypothetical protein [Actinoplanes siamensis]|uniref:Uncharacterized protein n=1 Tax=Actinoplanes siamensis TaxID=1223317 RepID=A0A919K7P1_9ACTN|nr:hypothetical protein [Actinoplanes siamensis]GIF02481.1 hypothetical protein Asi03nite_00190 [Actinoplanes siamensis]